MTIIDSLVVKLGLDSSDLDKKSTAASRKLKELEAQSGKTEGSVKKIGASGKAAAAGMSELTKGLAAFAAMVGAATAVAVAFAEAAIDSGAALDRLSKNLNVSVGDITAWGNAAEESGGKATGVQSAMQMLSKAQTDIQLTGNSGLIPYLNMLGVSLADTQGHALKSTDVLLQLAGAAEGKDRRTVNNVFSSMGFDEGTINLLLRGRNELQLTLARQKEYGEQAAKFAPEATKMQRSLVDLKQQFSLLGLSLMQQAAPAIEKVLAIFTRLGDWCKNNVEFLKDLALVLGTIGAGLGIIAVATSPITLVVAGVMALAGAIALLWQDYQTWQRGGQSLIDWSKWQPGILAAETAIKNLVKIARESFGAIYDSANGAMKFLHGDFKGAAASFKKSDDTVRGALSTAVAAAHQEVGILHDPSMKLRNAKALGAVATPPPVSATGPVTEAAAWAEAQRVAAKTGVSADVIMAQFRHESGNFKNRGARELNNISGINVPGGHGQDYRKFKSLDEYGDYYASLLMRRYKGALGAQDTDTFAKGLKEGGYFTDSLSNYQHGMRSFYNPLRDSGLSSQLMAAGNGRTTTNNHDNGVTIHGDVRIETRATDGQGVVQAFRGGMNGLLVTQNAAGLS